MNLHPCLKHRVISLNLTDFSLKLKKNNNYCSNLSPIRFMFCFERK